MYSILIATVVLCIIPVFADYDCVCNYNVEAGVYKQSVNDGQPIGYLYEFDCKPKTGEKIGNFYGIMYEKQVVYIEINPQVQLQTCPGEIPLEDKLTTVAVQTTTPVPTMAPTTETTSIPTTPMPTTTTQATTASTTQTITASTTQTTTTTTQSTTVLTTPRPSTAMSTTTTTQATTVLTTTTSSQTLEGHIELCQDFIKTDASRNHGFVGQYGQFCYELVDTPTQWKNADRHCKVENGNLVHVLNQNEQDYIVRFLNNHTYVKAVWLGLTDAGINMVSVGNSTEGNWQWTSGAPYTYNNFGKEFASQTETQHKNNDCIVMKQGGEWIDIACGVVFGLGFGAGESHPYICQYNVSATLPSILDILKPVVVG